MASTRLQQEINSTFSTQEFIFGVLGISHNDVISRHLWHSQLHRRSPVNVVYMPLPWTVWPNFFYFNILFQYMHNASFFILYHEKQMHNYLTNYHTPTCIDTTVSSSDSLYSIKVFQMQLLVIQFTIKMFHIGFMQVLVLYTFKSQYYKIIITLKLSYFTIKEAKIILLLQFSWSQSVWYGDRGGTVVKMLRYKSEGLWFDSRWCHWNFSLT